MAAKSVVMVCGAARSGTTMLDLMLGNSADAFSCGEVYAMYRPFRSHHFKPVCSCGDPACAIWHSLRAVPESRFHQAALGLPGINHVVDSSKDLRWVLDSNEWAQRNGLMLHNVVIWKDPVDLAYSHWKRGRAIDRYRREFLTYYERFLALNLPFVAVSYTELVNSPAAVLDRLCSMLGLPAVSRREEFWHKSHHHVFGSAGTARQVSSGTSRVGLDRNFPEDFRQAFAASSRASGDDARMAAAVRALQQAATGSLARPQHDPARAVARAMGRPRPVWYYRHGLKAWFRRLVPERRPVVD